MMTDSPSLLQREGARGWVLHSIEPPPDLNPASINTDPDAGLALMMVAYAFVVFVDRIFFESNFNDLENDSGSARENAQFKHVVAEILIILPN